MGNVIEKKQKKLGRTLERRKKRKERLFYASQISKVLKILTGVNVFSNSRKREVIETRAMLVYMLREVHDMSLFQVRDFFRNNGKEYNHATVLHAQNSYPMYRKFNKKLDPIFELLLEKTKSPNAKKLLAKQFLDKLNTVETEILIYIMSKLDFE